MDVYIRAKAFQWKGVSNGELINYVPYNPESVCNFCKQPYNKHGMHKYSKHEYILCVGEWLIVTPRHTQVLSNEQFEAECFNPTLDQGYAEGNKKILGHVRKTGLPMQGYMDDPQGTYPGDILYDMLTDALLIVQVKTESDFASISNLLKYLVDGGTDIEKIHYHIQDFIKEYRLECAQTVINTELWGNSNGL